MSEARPIAGVILAAGRSSRYLARDPAAASKVVAPLAGEALVRRVARAALGANLSPVVVVTGFARPHVEQALAGLAVSLVHNPDFGSGLASSLKAGVAALPEDCPGAAILLADMPMVSAALIGRLTAAAAAHPEAAAVVPTWNGRRGNPAIIRASLFGAVGGLEGDVGARPLLQGRRDVVEVAIDDASVALDVDTPEALGDLSR